jgi:hypothetical protein
VELYLHVFMARCLIKSDNFTIYTIIMIIIMMIMIINKIRYNVVPVHN